jgi:hypothetical protein
VEIEQTFDRISPLDALVARLKERGARSKAALSDRRNAQFFPADAERRAGVLAMVRLSEAGNR